MVFGGNSSQCVPLFDFMIKSAFGRAASGVCRLFDGYRLSFGQVFIGLIGEYAVLAVDEGADNVVGQTKYAQLAVAGNDILFVLGIQAAKLVKVDVAHFCHLL